MGVTFNVSDLMLFASGTNDEAYPTNLRTNPSQEGGDDGGFQAKGPTIEVMSLRIQEDYVSTNFGRPKLVST